MLEARRTTVTLVAGHMQQNGRIRYSRGSDAWEAVRNQLNGVLQTGESVSFEAVPLTLLQNGLPELSFWNYAYSPILSKEHEIVGIVNISQNVTAQRRAEEQLVEVKEDA